MRSIGRGASSVRARLARRVSSGAPVGNLMRQLYQVVGIDLFLPAEDR